MPTPIRAAVLQKPGEPLQNVEVLLDGPTDHEVLGRTERVGAEVIVAQGGDERTGRRLGVRPDDDLPVPGAGRTGPRRLDQAHAAGRLPSVEEGLQVLQHEFAHRDARLPVALPTCGSSTALSSLRSSSGTSGSSSYTSSPAPSSAPDGSASTRARVSTTSPRAVLTRNAPGFIRASRAASSRCRFGPPPGTCTDTMSAVSSTSSNAVEPAGPAHARIDRVVVDDRHLEAEQGAAGHRLPDPAHADDPEGAARHVGAQEVRRSPSGPVAGP